MRNLKWIRACSLPLIAWVALTGCSSPEEQSEYTIQQGPFEATLVETGELLAVNSRPVIIPYIGWKYGWQFKITGLAEHGSQVHAGDSVAQLDPANVMKFLVDEKNKFEVEQANMTKILVEQANKKKELETKLEEVQADYNLKKLELEKFRFESDRKKQVKELEFEQARINVEKAKKAIELEKIISSNTLKIQRIKLDQIRGNIGESENAVQTLTIHSPIDGMFQVAKNRRNQLPYKVGDDTYQGAILALVPDLDWIKVKSTVNEADIGKIRPGQKVIIRLEAYPDKPFTGKLTEIGKLSHPKERDAKVKVFDTEIVIEGSDPALKPGMTVSCEIYHTELDKVLYVDNRCLKKTGGSYFLKVKERGTWSEQAVEVGPRNNNFTVIYGDFKPGTEVAPLMGTQLAAANQNPDK